MELEFETLLPNNSMHPTRISVDVIRKVESLSQSFRAGDAWR